MTTFRATLRLLLDLLTGRLAKRILALEYRCQSLVHSQNALLFGHGSLRRKTALLDEMDRKLTRDVAMLNLWRLEGIEREKRDKETAEILQAFTLEEDDEGGEKTPRVSDKI